jgi:hypothetical protein
MAFPLHRALWVLSVVVLASVAQASRARACSGCFQPSVLHLPSARTVPNNLFAFEVLFQTGAQPQLRTADGEPIATRLRSVDGGEVLEPAESLAVGTSVELEVPIYNPGSQCEPTSTYRLEVGAAVEVELEAPSLTLLETGLFSPPGSTPSRVSHFAFDSGAGSDAVQSVMRHFATIDGSPASIERDEDGRLTLRAFAYCGEPTDAQLLGGCSGGPSPIEPGLHTLEAWSTIAALGIRTETASLDFSLDCPAIHSATCAAVAPSAAPPQLPATIALMLGSIAALALLRRCRRGR